MSRFFRETRSAQPVKTDHRSGFNIADELLQIKAQKTQTMDLSSHEQHSELLNDVCDYVSLQRHDTQEAPGLKDHVGRRIPDVLPSGMVFSYDGCTLHTAGEAFKRLRTRIMKLQAQQPLRSVVISSATPGEGKTFTALNLALCCAQLQNFPVLLIDADLRTQGLSLLLNIPAGPGLADVLAGRVDYNNAVASTANHNLFVTPAGADSLPPPELFARSGWKQFLEWSNRTFKVVIIDSPPILELTDFELISTHCDATLVVVRAASTQRKVLRRCSLQLDSRKVAGVVFNAAQSVKNEYYYEQLPQKKSRLFPVWSKKRTSRSSGTCSEDGHKNFMRD